jgi:hypothetical protein
VVALFNAIAPNQASRMAQDEYGSGSGPSTASARQVKELSKENFLAMLKKTAAPGSGPIGAAAATSSAGGGNSTGPKGADATAQASSAGAAGAGGKDGSAAGASSTASAWLHDDFMTKGLKGKSIKDWERHEELGGSDDDDDGEDDGPAFSDDSDGDDNPSPASTSGAATGKAGKGTASGAGGKKTPTKAGKKAKTKRK